MGLSLARALLNPYAREEELGMARQHKKLPARRRNAVDESLLIRSAESLGRVIGSLQRQLDAARRLVGPVAVDQRKNGHAPARRSGVSKERRQGVPADSAKPAAKAAQTKSAATAKKRTTTARKRAASSGRASKAR
jgi:hypothetical protein